MEPKEIVKRAKKIFDAVGSYENKLVVGIEIEDPARDAYAGEEPISKLMLIARIRELEHSIGEFVKILYIDEPTKKRKEDPLVEAVERVGLGILGPCGEIVSRKPMRFAVLEISQELPETIHKPPEKALKKVRENLEKCPVAACGESFDYKACESYRKKTMKEFSKKLKLACNLCRYF